MMLLLPKPAILLQAGAIAKEGRKNGNGNGNGKRKKEKGRKQAALTRTATYDEPHQFATGVNGVLVNRTPVLSTGKPAGAFPGQVVAGPGWTGWETD